MISDADIQRIAKLNVIASCNIGYQLGREHEIGRIAPGYQASFILVNSDLLTMDPMTIQETAKTTETWIDGKNVFRLS